MGGQRVNRWAAAARIAARQHGVISRVQLFGLGIGRGEIDTRLADGRLRALHRGVYLLGPALLPYSRQMAAVLACKPNAYLSHVSLGKLLNLLPYVPNPVSHHVTVAGRNPGKRPGIRVHRVASLGSHEVTTKHGIPITTPTRLILDLATCLDDGDLEQAIAEAFARQLTTRAKILDAANAQPGSARIRKLLEGAPARTRSKTERRLLTLLRRAGVPEPEVNVKIGGWEVDLLWRDRRLAVELDGYASHSSPRAFARDYRKAAELEQLGLRVLRVSADQVWDEPQATVARIRV
jgi:very-short-patch-repair endonuclease